MATFILVHGAWHGGWCFDEVAPLLRAEGHTVVAPDLPGMGNDRTDLATVTLNGWADFVADLVANAKPPVVLVGHSRGGIVISAAAERVPDRIDTLVYLAAFLVPNGQTLADMLARVEGPEVARDPLDFDATGLTSTVKPEKVVPVFYNTTPAHLAARAQQLITAEPMMSFVTPVAITADRFGRVPRAYIECVEDNAVPIALQRLMHADLPCDPVVTLDTDHSPFFSAPAALARALIGIGAVSRAAA